MAATKHNRPSVDATLVRNVIQESVVTLVAYTLRSLHSNHGIRNSFASILRVVLGQKTFSKKNGFGGVDLSNP